MHDPGPQAGHLQHFVVRNSRDLAGFGNNSRIRGVYPVDIGVDLAFIRVERCGQSGCSGIAATSSQGGDVAVLAHALKTAGNDDSPGIQFLLEPIGRDLTDTSLGVRLICNDPNLLTSQADGLLAQCADRHSHQSHSFLLPGREQHVHLARLGVLGNLIGQIDQLVGLFSTCATNHDDLMSGLFSSHSSASCGKNPFRGSNAGSAELLHDQRHETCSPESTKRNDNLFVNPNGVRPNSSRTREKSTTSPI